MRTRVFLLMGIISLCQNPAHAQQSEGGSIPPIRRVSMGVMAGNIVSWAYAKYPEEARAKQFQGDVLLDVTIDTEGRVVTAKVLKGDPLLTAAALKAVKQWLYRPYFLNYEPVPVQFPVLMKFRIPGVPYQEEEPQTPADLVERNLYTESNLSIRRMFMLKAR